MTSNNANTVFEKQIWYTACVLWRHIPVAEYRKVIVGLIFLKYLWELFSISFMLIIFKTLYDRGNILILDFYLYNIILKFMIQT